MSYGVLAEIYASQIRAIKLLSIFLTASFDRDGYSDRTETLEWYPRLSWEFVSRDEIRALRKGSRGKSQEREWHLSLRGGSFNDASLQRVSNFENGTTIAHYSTRCSLTTHSLFARESDDCALAFPATYRVSQQVETRGWLALKFCMARVYECFVRFASLSLSLSRSSLFSSYSVSLFRPVFIINSYFNTVLKC